MTERELKPCPFCGSDALTLGHLGYTLIECSNDDCQVRPYIYPKRPKSRSAVVAAWNTRADLLPTLSATLALQEVNALADAAMKPQHLQLPAPSYREGEF